MNGSMTSRLYLGLKNRKCRYEHESEQHMLYNKCNTMYIMYDIKRIIVNTLDICDMLMFMRITFSLNYTLNKQVKLLNYYMA
jgi:hypothetical protein